MGSGGYEAIDLGTATFALGAMTGCEDLVAYEQCGSSGDYKCYQPVWTKNNVHEGVNWDDWRAETEDLPEDAMFEALVDFNTSSYVMTCGSNGGSDEETSAQRIVQAH